MIRALFVVSLVSLSLSLSASSVAAQQLDTHQELEVDASLQAPPAPKIGGPIGLFVGSTVGTVGFTLAFAVSAIDADSDAATIGTLVGTVVSGAAAIAGLVWFIVRKIQRNRWRRTHGLAQAQPFTLRW